MCGQPTTANPAAAITWGVGRLMVGRLINEAILYVREDFDVRLKVRRLPKAIRANGNRDELWAALQEAIDPTCVAIVGLTGKHSHWTVATEVTAHQMQLFDSSSMSVVRRSECTIGGNELRTSLSPTHLIFISRHD